MHVYIYIYIYVYKGLSGLLWSGYHSPLSKKTCVRQVHPVRNPRFASFRTQPLENLSAAVELPVTKRFLGNPTLGTNLGSRILAMRTGCSARQAVPSEIWSSQHVKDWEHHAIKPVVTYDAHSLGRPQFPLEMGGALGNPAPRNHFSVWIVKPPGCHCTDALSGEQIS